MSIYKMRTDFGHHFKWILGFIALVFVVGAIWQFGAAPPSGPGGTQNRGNLAMVGDIPVTGEEYNANWNLQTSAESNRRSIGNSTMQLAKLRASILFQLIEGKMLLAAAKKMGVDVSEDAVNQRYEQKITEYLRQNRRMLVSKLDPGEEAMDPREDSKYLDKLDEYNRSLSQIEDQARATIPKNDLQDEVARLGISKKIGSELKRVTAKDIASSYNVYKVREIFVSSQGLPKEQVQNKVTKLVKEARAGKDFAALAKQNSAKKNGGQMEYKFDNLAGAMNSVAQQVVFQHVMSAGGQFDQKAMMREFQMLRQDPVLLTQAMRQSPRMIKELMMLSNMLDMLKKFKPGEVVGPIETAGGYYILKLESVKNVPPAKPDKKAIKERSDQIRQAEALAKWMAVDSETRKTTQVKVTDPEMSGYWHQYRAQQAMMSGDQAAYKKELAVAAKQLKQAFSKDKSNGMAGVTYSLVLAQMDQTKEAASMLYSLLEGSRSNVQGADLRLILGRLLLKQGKPKDKDRALIQFAKASDAAVIDRGIHEQLVTEYKQLGMKDLAAKETALIAEIDQKTKVLRERAQAANKAKSKPSKPK